MEKRSLEFFPGNEFIPLDTDIVLLGQAIKDIKVSIATTRFNLGITDLEFQLECLNSRIKQLERYFFKETTTQLEEGLIDLQLDILHTKKDIDNRRYLEVNIILDEMTNKLLEKYQLL